MRDFIVRLNDWYSDSPAANERLVRDCAVVVDDLREGARDAAWRAYANDLGSCARSRARRGASGSEINDALSAFSECSDEIPDPDRLPLHLPETKTPEAADEHRGFAVGATVTASDRVFPNRGFGRHR